jgi:hypothetical protein
MTLDRCGVAQEASRQRRGRECLECCNRLAAIVVNATGSFSQAIDY